MKADRSRWHIFSIVLLIAAARGIGTQTVAADILFSDDFNRNGVLTGSTPDYVNPTNYPSGLTWVSTGSGHNNTTTDNGGQEIGGWNARLAFTLQEGKHYKLTLNAGPTIQNALIWGFAYDTGGFADYNYLSQDVLDMVWARMGSVDGGVYDYGTDVSGSRTVAGTYTLDANTGPGYENKLELLLNTGGGLSSAHLTLKVNDVTKGTWTANVTGYNSVVFGRGTGTQDPNSTQISDLTLEILPPLSVTIQSPTNSQIFTSSAFVTATAAVTNGTGPYSVTFFTNIASHAFAQAGTAVTNSPYQVSLGVMPWGINGIYAVATDRVGSTAVSVTNRFSVLSAGTSIIIK